MPPKSPEQERLMRAVAHNAAFAKKVGIPQSVGREFAAADKQKHQQMNNKRIVKALMRED